MIIAKLINPQIFYIGGVKESFTNTLVYELDGVEIERSEISLPYAMPDPDIEVLVKKKAEEKTREFLYNQAYAAHAEAMRADVPEISDDDILSSFVFDEPELAPQDSLQWDWPEGVE